MGLDPTVTNPAFCTVLFENDRVRVLKYSDSPADATTVHEHPDSVMVTLSSFRRRLVHGDSSATSRSPRVRRTGCPLSGTVARTSATQRHTRSSLEPGSDGSTSPTRIRSR